MSEPLAYREGRFLPQSQAGLPLNDAAFVQAATITDLVRTFHLRPFLWNEHLIRFRQSSHISHITIRGSDADLQAAAERLVAHNARLLSAGQELGLVLFASPGPIGWYLGEPGGPGDAPPTLGMHTFPLPFARYRRLIRDGATLLCPSVRQVPAATIDRRIKHRSRLFWWLAEQEVRQRDPTASALLLDGDATITETAAANVLLVRAGRVLTPPADRVLGGISLAFVRGLCGELGIPFEERLLTLEDCYAADEALLTCTSFCLAPVARLERHLFSTERPVFEQLLTAWSARVGLDIRAQILGH